MQSTTATADEGGNSLVQLSSDEVNILIYLYLLESNFTHTAFTLLSESALPSSSLFQAFNPSYPVPTSATSSLRNPPPASRANGSARSHSSETFGTIGGKIARGELIRKLWKALRWEEIERHSGPEAQSTACRTPFRLLVPHSCLATDETDDHATSPPTKRPEPFPEPRQTPQPTPAIDGSDQNATRDVDIPRSPLPGHTKRKVSGDAATTGLEGQPSPTGTSDQMAENENTPLGEQSDTPAPDLAGALHVRKRVKESEAKPSEPQQRSRSTTSRSRGTMGATKLSLAKQPGNSPTEVDQNVGCWNEHRDTVTCIAWNPKDKDVLVTGSSDGTAKLWDFHESTNSHTLKLVKKPHTISHKSIDSGKKAVTALVWHPDGTFFATASDGVGRLFTPSGQLQGILTYGRGTINSLKFNPSGTSLLAAKDDFTVCLFILDFDLKSPKQLSFEAHTKEVNDVDWFDDDVFASGGNDHTIFIHRANDRRPRFTLKGHTDDVTKVKWSPLQSGGSTGSRLLASASDDGTVIIWNLPHYPVDRGTTSRSLSPSKQPREKEQSSEELFQMTVSPGSEYLVNRLVIVSGETENKRMSTLEWSPACREGRMIVAAGGQDSTVKLFNASTGECLHVLSGLEGGTGSISFSPLSTSRPWGLIAGGGWNAKAIIWDVDTGKPLQEHEIEEEPDRQAARDKPMMMAMAWRNDGQHLALGLHNKSLLTMSTGSLF